MCTEQWNNHRPKVMACCCCMWGLFLLILSSAVFAGRVGEEVQPWFAVPLCSTSSGDFWVSRDLDAASSTCPSGLGGPSDAQDVNFRVPHSSLIAGFTYHLFVYRTQYSDIWNDVAFLEASVGEALNVDTRTDTATTSSTSTRRRLLKGSSFGGSSYSSGPSYRSRGGDFSYFGSSTPILRARSRSSTSPVVPQYSVVTVYSAAPVLSQPDATAPRSFREQLCSNPTDGCEYVVTTPFLKDEFTLDTITAPETLDTANGFWNLRVKAAMNYTTCATPPCSVATRDYPNLFMVLASDGTNPEAVAGFVLIPLACLIICCGTVAALSMDWRFCPDCGVKMNGTTSGYSRALSAGGGGSAHGGMSSNPMHEPTVGPEHLASDRPTTKSIVKMPMPTATGLMYSDIGGSHSSLAFSHANAATVVKMDLTNNDVTSVSGVGGFPSLQVLVLNNNDLSNLLGLHAASSLAAVEADSNSLHTLRGVAGMLNLRWFKAADNDIKSMEGAQDLPALTYLCLANNDLTTTAGLQNMPALTHVDLSHNALRNIVGMDTLSMLIGVDLSDNDLTNADEVIRLARLHHLTVLDVRGNDFTARDKQRIRDAFAAKPQCTLLS